MPTATGAAAASSSYLNNDDKAAGKLVPVAPRALVVAKANHPRVLAEQFAMRIGQLETLYNCKYFANVSAADFSIKCNQSKKGTERWYMNWQYKGKDHYGHLRVFLPPHRVSSADMPPVGNMKQFLSTERAATKFGDYAPKTLQKAEMSVGLSGEPLFQGAPVDAAGRGVPQGQAQEFLLKLHEIGWDACVNQHPMFEERLRQAYADHEKANCKKCSEAKNKDAMCKRKNQHGAIVHLTPLSKEKQAEWDNTLRPGLIKYANMPIVVEAKRGPTVYCQSEIWTKMTREERAQGGVPLDAELLADPDHQHAYALGYYMKDPIKALDVAGNVMPYSQAVLLNYGDIIIPIVEIWCDFKYGNEKGKFHLNVSCRSWQLLQRGVRGAPPPPPPIERGFNWTAEIPGLELAPVDPKLIEERAERSKKAQEFMEGSSVITAEQDDDELEAKQKRIPYAPKKFYARLVVPRVVPAITYEQQQPQLPALKSEAPATGSNGVMAHDVDDALAAKIADELQAQSQAARAAAAFKTGTETRPASPGKHARDEDSQSRPGETPPPPPKRARHATAEPEAPSSSPTPLSRSSSRGSTSSSNGADALSEAPEGADGCDENV